jgi:hypothetical protein
MSRTSCLFALVVTVLHSHPGRAQARRFPVATSQAVYVTPSQFAEGEGAATAGVAGVVGHAFSTTLVQVPMVVDQNDTFLWAVQHSYDAYDWRQLEVHEASTFARGAAFDEPARAPFESLQILRGMWTWRHAFESGYNLYLHNRTGIHSDALELETRRFRIGAAAALERQWSPDHTFGGGMVVLWGIGGVQPIPFLRYRYQSPEIDIFALLPLWARFYLPLGDGAELGLVFEADGNRYRVEQAGQPFDNVDLVYSYWGPSFRLLLGHDAFLRADVGMSGYRVLDLYLDQKLTSSLELDRTAVVAVSLSWEPTY